MEEEINYASVVFKNGGPNSKERKEEETVYSEVIPKAPTTTAVQAGQAAGRTPGRTPGPTPVQAAGPTPGPTPGQAAGPKPGQAAARSHFSVLALCSGILLVLLVASVSGLIYLKVLTDRQRGELYNVTAEYEKLEVEKTVLDKKMENLSRVTENLNGTLNAILKFDNFPVNEYCPEKKCQPCKKDWILFKEKCYLFYNKESPWLRWDDSRQFCQNANSDLVVIESREKQEFISNHTQFYYDENHGYWMGLRKIGNNWIWVDGSNDTLSYWVKTELGTVGPYGLMIPGRNLTDSWDKAEIEMRNKFICEREALIRSDQV